MAAEATDPTKWADNNSDTPPVNWQAVASDGRFWFSYWLGIEGPVKYIGSTPLPDILEFEVEVTDEPASPYSHTVFTYFLDGSKVESFDCGVGVGTTQISIDTTGFPDGSEFSFVVDASSSGDSFGDSGMYDGVAAVLGPAVADECDACFDVGHLCTSPLSGLVSDVMQEVEKCSDPQVESVIRDVVIDFLKRSKLLSFDHPAISLEAGVSSYKLQNPCGFQILHVRSATIKGKPFRLTSEEQLDMNWTELSRGWSWRYQFSESANSPSDDWRLAESDLPALGYQLNPNEIRVVGVPTADLADALLLKVVVFPDRDVTSIPKWIFNTWYQAIVSGSIGWLKGMVGKPFSDRQAAAGYIEVYEQAILEAESSALRGFKRNDQPIRRTKIW